MRRESATDCFLREQDFFVLQRPKFWDYLYIYWETIPEVTRSTTISTLSIGDEHTPSIWWKDEYEKIPVTTPERYFSIGVLVVRVNVFQGNRETILGQLMTP